MKTTLALCALAACGPTTSKTTAAETGSHASQFAYDATGLPTRITTDGVVHDVVAPPRDALGRATSLGAAMLAYGPDGRLASATLGADTFEYITDETGHRLAKKKNGAFVEAYVDEGVVSDTLYSPVVFAGTTLGVVHHGAFETIATDPRGTLLADAAGVTRTQTFGERARASTLGSAIDYAQSGRDADLGVIRMGVRDYDPASHEFLTPDPLFLVNPDRCVTSPVECNLYSYARNRPADFVDPTGTDGVPGNFILSGGLGPVGVEYIKGHEDWSLRLDLGSVPQGFAGGWTSQGIAKSEVAFRFGAQANLSLGPLTVFQSQATGKISTASYALPNQEAKEHFYDHLESKGSFRVLGAIGSLKVTADGVTPQGELRMSDGLLTPDMKVESSAGVRASISFAVTGSDLKDAWESAKRTAQTVKEFVQDPVGTLTQRWHPL